MLSVNEINKLIDVEESFHASYKLMDILKDEDSKEELFNAFLQKETDLTYDWFLEYYQSEHSDRKRKMQDFTPHEVSEIASKILGESNSNMDMCSGVGGLTIKRWVDNPNQIFHCEEFSDRAIPFLLFNLSIRNIAGTVKHGDSLTRQFKAIYKLSKGDKFSKITKSDIREDIKVDSVIMNPPYSMKWEHEESYLTERRFKEFEKLAPKSKADYAFLLTGLDKLNEDGTMTIVLPHGVLFRSGAEGTIRQKLIEYNLIDSIIGLPENIFLNTTIPTIIMVLKRNKKTDNILFIDASEGFEKDGPINRLRTKDVNKIIKTYQDNKEIDRYSKMIEINEIKKNDYNLNIPRYVDKYIPEEVPEVKEILRDLREIDKEIEESKNDFLTRVSQLRGKTEEKDQEIQEFLEYFGINRRKDENINQESEQVSFYDKL